MASECKHDEARSCDLQIMLEVNEEALNVCFVANVLFKGPLLSPFSGLYYSSQTPVEQTRMGNYLNNSVVSRI